MSEARSAAATTDGGFTLVEVVVGMVLLALVALAMMPVLATGARTAATNRDMAKAAQYASSELMYARQMTCADVKTAVLTGNGFLSPVTSPGPPPKARAGYTVIDTFTDTPGGSCKPGQTFTLTATVSLDGSAARPVTATTLVLVP